MSQKITPSQKDCFFVMNEEKRTQVNPSKKSLKFILQFAHSYHVEKALPPSLFGMVLN